MDSSPSVHNLSIFIRSLRELGVPRFELGDLRIWRILLIFGGILKIFGSDPEDIMDRGRIRARTLIEIYAPKQLQAAEYVIFSR